MEHKKIRVGVVQATPALFNKEKSIDIVISWIQIGSEAGCKFLLFPESFIPCYPRGFNFDAVVGKRTDKSRSLWLDYYEASIDVSTGELDRLKAAIKKAGLFVDDLVGQQQIVVKNLESNYRKVAGISGATILGDGGVSLILDVSALLRVSCQLNVDSISI